MTLVTHAPKRTIPPRTAMAWHTSNHVIYPKGNYFQSVPTERSFQTVAHED